MRHCLRLAVAILVVSIGLATPAIADNVTWYVTGTFDDGGTVSGSYVYNVDTDVYSAIDVTTTSGTTLSGADYAFFDTSGGSESADFLLFVTTDIGDLIGTPVFSAYIDSGMTDAGGTINFDIGGPYYSEESCVNSSCSGPASPYRYLTSGYVSSTPISSAPEPSSFALFGMGLVGIVGAMRRKLRG